MINCDQRFHDVLKYGMKPVIADKHLMLLNIHKN